MNKVPNEIWTRILEFIEPELLCRVNRLSRRFYQLASQTWIWKFHCHFIKLHPLNNRLPRCFSTSSKPQTPPTLHQSTYQYQYTLRRNYLEEFKQETHVDMHDHGIIFLRALDAETVVSASWDGCLRVWRLSSSLHEHLFLGGKQGRANSNNNKENTFFAGDSNATPALQLLPKFVYRGPSGHRIEAITLHGCMIIFVYKGMTDIYFWNASTGLMESQLRGWVRRTALEGGDVQDILVNDRHILLVYPRCITIYDIVLLTNSGTALNDEKYANVVHIDQMPSILHAPSLANFHAAFLTSTHIIATNVDGCIMLFPLYTTTIPDLSLSRRSSTSIPTQTYSCKQNIITYRLIPISHATSSEPSHYQFLCGFQNGLVRRLKVIPQAGLITEEHVTFTGMDWLTCLDYDPLSHLLVYGSWSPQYLQIRDLRGHGQRTMPQESVSLSVLMMHDCLITGLYNGRLQVYDFRTPCRNHHREKI